VSDLKRLEESLQQEPDDDQVAAELYRELQEETGYSVEEAAAHVDYLRVMARRKRLIDSAGKLLEADTPTRRLMIRLILEAVNLTEVTGAAFHITTTAGGPSVEDKPREVAGRERVVVIRVPAEWLLTQRANQDRRIPRFRPPKGGQ